MPSENINFQFKKTRLTSKRGRDECALIKIHAYSAHPYIDLASALMCSDVCKQCSLCVNNNNALP